MLSQFECSASLTFGITDGNSPLFLDACYCYPCILSFSNFVFSFKRVVFNKKYHNWIFWKNGRLFSSLKHSVLQVRSMLDSNLSISINPIYCISYKRLQAFINFFPFFPSLICFNRMNVTISKKRSAATSITSQLIINVKPDEKILLFNEVTISYKLMWFVCKCHDSEEKICYYFHYTVT